MEFSGKDKEIYDKSKCITFELIDDLFSKKCLKMYVTLQEDALTDKVRKRVNLGEIITESLIDIITNENWKPFANSMNNFGFSQERIFHICGVMIVNQFLDIVELLRKYLLVALDKEKLSLKGNEPLGIIFSKFDENGINYRLGEYLDKNIRNAIAHGWYWFSNNDFNYVIDPKLKKTKTISLGELFVKRREASLLTRSFIDNAFERILELQKSTTSFEN